MPKSNAPVSRIDAQTVAAAAVQRIPYTTRIVVYGRPLRMYVYRYPGEVRAWDCEALLVFCCLEGGGLGRVWERVGGGETWEPEMQSCWERRHAEVLVTGIFFKVAVTSNGILPFYSIK